MGLSEILLENAKKEKLFETASSDIENYEEFLNSVISDNIRTFIGYDIADVQPLKQPTGRIFARSSRLDKFEIVSKPVTCTEKKSTIEISQEAQDDLKALTGSDELLTNFIVAKTKRDESLALVAALKAAAIPVNNITITGDNLNNHETNLFFISKKVNEEIAKMNKDNFKTYDAAVILPVNNAGGILGMSFTYSRSLNVVDDTNKARDYYLGSINQVSYYINPDPNETDVIITLNSKTDKGVSGLIYSPYNLIVTSSKHFETAHSFYNVFLRDAFTINPMHNTNSPFIVKFKIQ